MAVVTQLQGGYEGPDTIPDKGTTTLIIKNVPRSYTPQAIMSELKLRCPTCRYNFVYLPWYKRRGDRLRRGCNIGFAFLNFVDAGSAMRAFFALSGSAWTLVVTTKTCRVSAAHIQGLRENLANYVAIAAQTGVEEVGAEEDEGPRPPIVIQDGSIMELSKAILMLCTEEMIQEAMDNNRTNKRSQPQLQNFWCSVPCSGPYSGLTPQPHSSSQHSVDVRIQHSSSPMEGARDFRKAFLEFCLEVARNAADHSVEVGRLEGGEDVANVERWMNFRSFCIWCSEIAPTISDVERPEHAARHAACGTSWRHTSPASFLQEVAETCAETLEQPNHLPQESHTIKRFACEHGYAPGQWGIHHQLPMSNSRVQLVLAANDAVRLPHEPAPHQRTFLNEGTNGMLKPMPNSMADLCDLEIPIPLKLLASTSVDEPCVDTISLQL